MNSPATAVAAIPELLERIALSLPLDDPESMRDVFAWMRVSTLFQQLIAKSWHLQRRLYLLDERSVDFTMPGRPWHVSRDAICIHDIRLQANPLIPTTLPGFKELRVDYDELEDCDTCGTCRRWHFAMELDPRAAPQWRNSAAVAHSWRGLLLTQPACKGVTFSWLERDVDGNNTNHRTYDEIREDLYIESGITLGHVCD